MTEVRKWTAPVAFHGPRITMSESDNIWLAIVDDHIRTPHAEFEHLSVNNVSDLCILIQNTFEKNSRAIS